VGLLQKGETKRPLLSKVVIRRRQRSTRLSPVYEKKIPADLDPGEQPDHVWQSISATSLWGEESRPELGEKEMKMEGGRGPKSGLYSNQNPRRQRMQKVQGGIPPLTGGRREVGKKKRKKRVAIKTGDITARPPQVYSENKKMVSRAYNRQPATGRGGIKRWEDRCRRGSRAGRPIRAGGMTPSV